MKKIDPKYVGTDIQQQIVYVVVAMLACRSLDASLGFWITCMAIFVFGLIIKLVERLHETWVHPMDMPLDEWPAYKAVTLSEDYKCSTDEKQS